MKKALSRVAAEILEMADDMHRIGVVDDKTHHQITVRHLGREPLPTAEPISAGQIRAARERQLERGTKEAKGPVRALLNVIRRKGLEAIL